MLAEQSARVIRKQLVQTMQIKLRIKSVYAEMYALGKKVKKGKGKDAPHVTAAECQLPYGITHPSQ